MADPEYLTVERLSRSDIARIFSKIVVDPRTGCWLWTAWRSKHGYGKIKYERRTEATHRLMWAWLVGPLPRGQSRDIPNLDHLVCDVKLCCFPGHLKLGPPRDNTLRSSNAAAINSRKTHCPRGHELPTERNRPTGRDCTICRTAAHRTQPYKDWNAAFGRAYHQARRYGPDREAFLKRQREYMREWKRRRREKEAAH